MKKRFILRLDHGGFPLRLEGGPPSNCWPEEVDASLQKMVDSWNASFSSIIGGLVDPPEGDFAGSIESFNRIGAALAEEIEVQSGGDWSVTYIEEPVR